MTHLFHPHRQFDTITRWVYMAGDAPTSAEAPAPPVAPAPAEASAAPELTDEHIGKIRTEVGTAYDRLEQQLGQDVITKAEREKIDELKNGATAKIDALKKEYKDAQETAGAAADAGITKIKGVLNAEVDKLVAEINATKEGGASDTLDVAQEAKAREILAKQLGITKGEASKAGPLYEAWVALAKSPEWTELTKKLGIPGMAPLPPTEEDADKILSWFVATITPEQITNAERTGVIAPRPGQTKEILEKMKEDLFNLFKDKLPEGKVEATDAETTALTEFLTKKDAGDPKKIPDTARENVVKYLATRYEVTIEGEGDAKKLKIDGAEIANMDNLMAKLPDNFKTENITAEVLNKAATKGIENTEKLAAIREFMDKTMEKLGITKGKEDKESKGAWGDIGTLITAVTQLIEAWKTGDWQTLGDVMNDMQEGKNPLDEQKKAGEIYAKILETKTPPPALDMMLAAYMNPRGAEGNSIFGDANTQLTGEGVTHYDRYRSAAKDALKTHLEKTLGIQLSSVAQERNGLGLNYFKDNVAYKLIVGKTVDEGGTKKVRVERVSWGAAKADGTLTETSSGAYNIDATKVVEFIAAADLKAFEEQKISAPPAAPAAEPPAAAATATAEQAPAPPRADRK